MNGCAALRVGESVRVYVVSILNYLCFFCFVLLHFLLINFAYCLLVCMCVVLCVSFRVFVFAYVP